MQAKDIMTDNVITVRENTSIDDIAALMLEKHISALPVVDENNSVIGIVSEGDLIRRPELESEQPRSWWLRLITGSREEAADYVKTHGLRAAQIMTDNVLTVSEDTAIAEVAQLLEKHRIKRVPVVRDGKLIGIISRANLLQALAIQRHSASVTPPPQDDRSLRQNILEALRGKGWITHGTMNVIVSDGRVELWGWVDSEDERQALLLAVENIPGVRHIEDHLGSIPSYLRNV